MSYEQKELSGTLFKNLEKAEGSKQPDYQGDCLIRGEKLRISAWIKEGAKGKFMSLAFQEPYVQDSTNVHETRTPKNPEHNPAAFADMDDDLPAW